jgi:hypothetical protein
MGKTQPSAQHSGKKHLKPSGQKIWVGGLTTKRSHLASHMISSMFGANQNKNKNDVYKRMVM